jgi:hypothetical protein
MTVGSAKNTKPKPVLPDPDPEVTVDVELNFTPLFVPEQRLNMELDLQSLFELHVHSCTELIV